MSRVLAQSMKNIRRSPYRALAVMLILIVTLFTTQVFSLALFGSEQILNYFEQKPQVIAFFEEDASEGDIIRLRDALEAQEFVSSATFVSKEEALRIYQDQNQDDPLLLEMVTADILPASLEVSATEVEYLPLIRQQLEDGTGVEEVVYYQDVVEELQKWTNGIRTSGLVVVAYLTFTSVLVLTIITSIRVASKREEIKVQRLLGASSWYIRGPFVIEAALYGFFSALISWGATYILLLYGSPSLNYFLGEISMLPFEARIMLTLLLGTTSLGILLGMFSAFIASRRYSLV